ncbi:dynein regulatory complex subunit 4-like [Gouania willdenowi]|uniref:dynein regulatory complex subunit 4-like n=1 Tax=Gouania willdenowi TaxID=441366 RepID=UPI001055EC17|nr:dynein regulatory complex subunit 4-like [Gouania willdenowi]
MDEKNMLEVIQHFKNAITHEKQTIRPKLLNELKWKLEGLKKSRRNLQKTNAKLRTRQREKIEAEEAQRIETNIYRDKLENVQLERENMVFDAKVDSMALSNLVHNKHALTEIELCTELQELRANVKAEELNKQSCIQELQLKQNMELMELNNKYEDKCREVDSAYRQRMEDLYAAETRNLKTEIMTLEDEMDTRVKEIKIRKNRELERATELNAHNVACELKKKDKWKEELENANKLAQRQERKHLAAKNENKRLTEAIQKAELMKIHLLMDLEEYEKYKVKQRANQGRLNKLKKERHQQKVEKELLLQAAIEYELEQHKWERLQDKKVLNEQKQRMKEMLHQRLKKYEQ